MTTTILLAHAKGEESVAAAIAPCLEREGYEVFHAGTVLVGDSVVGRTLELLDQGCAVVLCGTIKAVGTRWAKQVATAARARPRSRVFVVQMDEEADVSSLAFSETVAEYWRDQAGAETKLVAALRATFPVDGHASYDGADRDLEQRYLDLALRSCDIIDLANLPADDRHLLMRELELRRLYVALRLRTEAEVSSKTLTAQLGAIEKRRKLWWSGIGQIQAKTSNVVSVGSRLNVSRRLVILGDPGSGKSTLLRWIATAYLLRLKDHSDFLELPDVATLPNLNYVPILVRCRDLRTTSETLEEILLDTLRKSEIPEASSRRLIEILRLRLEQGTGLLLIDGLDEIADVSARVKFASQIEQIHRALPFAPIVVTSRIVGYRDMGYRIGNGFEHLSVADLSPTDKDDFARRWCSLTERPENCDEATRELTSDIHSSDRIERLTGNPMLLTTMALIKRKVGKLPQRRVDLYEKAVEVLLNWRSGVDRVALDKREALPQLEYLASAMCRRGVQQLVEDDLLELLNGIRREFPHLYELTQHTPQEFLEHLEASTGLVVQSGHAKHKGRTVPVYEFRHLTVQEYLAGIALLQGHYEDYQSTDRLSSVLAPLPVVVSDRGLLKAPVIVLAENWREPLRLCVAAAPDKDVDSALLAILEPASTPGEAKPRAVVACLCLADEPNVTPAIAERTLRAATNQLGPDDFTTKWKGRGTLSAALLDVGSSRWSVALKSELLKKYEGDSKRLNPFGALYAFLNCNDILREDVSGEGFLSRLRASSESGQALTVSEMLTLTALCRRIGLRQLEPLYAIALLDRLGGNEAEVWSAIWTYTSLVKAKWVSVSDGDVLRLKDFLEGSHHKDEVISRVLLAVGLSNSTLNASKLMFRFLTHQKTQVRLMALQGLSRAPDPMLVDVLSKLAASESETLGICLSATAALGSINSIKAGSALLVLMQGANARVRRAALGAFLPQDTEPLDRRLMKESVKGGTEYLDPSRPITDARIVDVSRQLEISREEVAQRYSRLAHLVGIQLHVEPSQGSLWS